MLYLYLLGQLGDGAAITIIAIIAIIAVVFIVLIILIICFIIRRNTRKIKGNWGEPERAPH